MAAQSQVGAGPVTGKRILARSIRIIVVLGIGLALFFPVLFAVAWRTFAGGRLGWIPSLLAFSLLGLVTGWAAVSRHWATARRLTSITLAVIAGIGGIAAAHFAPATPGRLRHEIEVFAQPSWRLVDDAVDGNAFCFDYCTSVTREYQIEADLDDVLAELRPLLASRHCFRPTPGVAPNSWHCGDQAGDVVVTVDIARERNGVTTVSIIAG